MISSGTDEGRLEAENGVSGGERRTREREKRQREAGEVGGMRRKMKQWVKE